MSEESWIVNPSLDMPSVLAQYGRFLEEDYRMAIESMYVPEFFEYNLEPTGRRFVIIGGKDNPTLLSKSVYLCARLAGAESIDVRSNQMDETFLAQNVLEHHAGNTKHRVFIPIPDALSLHEDWHQALNDATDIVVFGNQDTMNAYRDYETVDRRVWEYGEKFSFGVVRAEELNAVTINNICFDFVAYYGDGRLAPKFYFVIGKITDKMIKSFSENMIAIYRPFIEEHRNKLPFTRKSAFAQQYIGSNYKAYYLREGKLSDKDILDPLYGDVRLIQVDDLEQINDFLIDYVDSISTVAVNIDDDYDMLDMLDDIMVPRVCPFGDMQFPDFFESYDALDDFNIYVKEEEEE